MDYSLSRKQRLIIRKLSFPGLYPISELKGAISNFSLSASTQKTVKMQASFDYRGNDLSDADVISISVHLDNGFEQEEVRIATMKVCRSGGSNGTFKVSCYGLTKYLADDRFFEPYSVSKGSDPFDVIEDILSSVNLRVAIRPPESNTIRTNKSYLPEEFTKLEIVNDLLDNAGYLAADTNEYGLVTFRTTVKTPKYSSIVFSEGQASIIQRDYELEQDWEDIANVVIVTCNNADDEVLRAIAVNDSLFDPTSTAFRGEVVRVESMSDADSQAVIDAKAADLLSEERSRLEAITFKCAYRPLLLFDHVRLKIDDIDAVYTVQNYELDENLVLTPRVRRYV